MNQFFMLLFMCNFYINDDVYISCIYADCIYNICLYNPCLYHISQTQTDTQTQTHIHISISIYLFVTISLENLYQYSNYILFIILICKPLNYTNSSKLNIKGLTFSRCILKTLFIRKKYSDLKFFFFFGT